MTNYPIEELQQIRHFTWITIRCKLSGQKMRKVGYARLRSEGCSEIFREKASGKNIANRPQLEKAFDELGTGDALVVAEWDRVTHSMMDGVHLIQRINKRGA